LNVSAKDKNTGKEQSIVIKASSGLSDEEKSQVEASVVSLEEAIASENTESIESATKNLNDVLTPLTQKLYAQDADSAEGGEEDNNAQEDADQNTVDAEYEEVKEEDK